MKKFLVSMMSVMAVISLTSCQSEEDMPNQTNPAATALEATFPKGAKVKTLSVKVPEDARTRAGETDLPLWDVFSAGSLYIRYAVYDTDGNLFYSSDAVSPQKQVTSQIFQITFPTPSEACKLFVWAEKTPLQAQNYKIDWENKTVSRNVNPNQYMGRDGDAWYCWVETANSFEDAENLTLSRPVSQVCVLSNELSIPGIQAKYGNSTIKTEVGFKPESGFMGEYMYPQTWHWDTETYDFAKTTNITFNYTPSTTPYKATFNGEEYDYLACEYYFTPRNADEYVDAATGKKFTMISISVKNNNNTLTTPDLGVKLTRNNRLILKNKAFGEGGTEGEGGILNKGTNQTLTVGVSDNYNMNFDILN